MEFPLSKCLLSFCLNENFVKAEINFIFYIFILRNLPKQNQITAYNLLKTFTSKNNFNA